MAELIVVVPFLEHCRRVWHLEMEQRRWAWHNNAGGRSVRALSTVHSGVQRGAAFNAAFDVRKEPSRRRSATSTSPCIQHYLQVSVEIETKTPET